MHLTASPVDWYAARAAGVAAYVLLSASVALGLTLSGGRAGERWPRFALEELHRAASLLVGVFVALHVVTVAIDAYLRLSLVSILVPFASTWRPVWVGLGVVAAELLLALAVTNLLRDRIGRTRWRTLHYGSFAVWGAATAHGLVVGTDRTTPWLLALEAVSIAVVAWLLASRLRLPAGPLLGAAAAGGAVCVPLLASPYHPRPWNAVRFHDRLVAVVGRDAGPTRELVSLAGQGDGEQRVLVRADVLVEPRGPLATAFQLEFLPSGLRCAGRIVRLTAAGFDGRCRTARGDVRDVRIRLTGAGAGTAEGTVDAG